MGTAGKTKTWSAVAALCAALLDLAPGPAAAQEPPPAPPAPPAAAPPAPPAPPAPREEELAIAKDLFRKGVALFNTGDYERALDYFLRSRAAVPSSKNTANAAICLDRLGRYDEALDLYEDLLLRFAAELDQEDRDNLGPAMAALRAKVGALRLSANVDGRVVIDGRARGKLPLDAPLRLLGGKHTVRIFKDGYTAFESRVDVPAGGVIAVEGHLTPLAETGILRVEDPASEGFDVFIDGQNRGKIPWEDPLSPGRHLVWIQRGDRGSMPRSVDILLGQTTLIRLEAAELGPPLRIEVRPETARIALDGIPLGVHIFQGRVPLGAHRLSLAEEGYVREEIAVTATKGGNTPASVRRRLRIDPNHPRWPRPQAGHFFASAVGGFGGGPSLGSRYMPEGSAPSTWGVVLGEDAASLQGPSRAGIAGVRGGYRFTTGLAAELSAGYLSFSAAPTDCAVSGMGGGRIDYALTHWIRARGAFAGLGGSYRTSPLSWLGLSTRVTGMVATLTVDDTITGFAMDPPSADASPCSSDPSKQLPLAVDNQLADRRQIGVFVVPELGFDVTFRRFFAGMSLGLAWSPGAGPTTGRREIGVTPRCSGTDDLEGAACAPDASLAREQAYGGFVLFVPQISAGIVF